MIAVVVVEWFNDNQVVDVVVVVIDLVAMSVEVMLHGVGIEEVVVLGWPCMCVWLG